MPHGNIEYMLDTLKVGFEWDKEYAKKEDLCTCRDLGFANFREFKFFEVDIPTPCTKDFQEWLADWGFEGLPTGLTPRQLEPHADKPAKPLTWFEDVFWKFFFKMIDWLIFGMMWRYPTGRRKWFKDKFQKYDKQMGHTHYRKFDSIHKHYARELPKSYKGGSKYNQRNIVIGRSIEYPIGTFSHQRCKVCHGKHSRH